MRAWADIVRRLTAGLALLAMLALSLSQAFALPRTNTPCCEDRLPIAMSIVGQAGNHAPGTPSHEKGHAVPDCCLAGDCSILAPALAPASLLLPIEPQAAIHQDAATPAPEGLGTLPAVPPPRSAI